MNLTSLREKIKNITDYSPELQQFNDQLDQLVNDAFYSLWTYKRWNFATRQMPFYFFPDITPSRDNVNAGGGTTQVNANVVEGLRTVTFSHSLDRLKETQVWEGCPISIQSVEYTVSRIITTTSILLDRPFEGTTDSDDVTWAIKKRFYDLPEDCLELLYIGHRDVPYNSVGGTQTPYGKATGLLPAKEEIAQLRMDYDREYAEAYIPSPTLNIPPGENISIDDAGEGITGTLDKSYHEFCWAFLKDGKVGPLSEPFTYHIQGNTTAINIKFLGWDDKPIYWDGYNSEDNSPNQWEGYRKVIFYNKNIEHATGERKGLPCWVYVTNGGTTRNDKDFIKPVIVEDTEDNYDLRFENQMNNGSPRYIERDGSHQRIRPYPRVNGYDVKVDQIKSGGGEILQGEWYWRNGYIRYYKKPQDLLCATDSPEMPYEFHQLIVYKALENIYLKLGNVTMANTYEKKAEKELKQLEKRYVDKSDYRPQKGQFTFAQNWVGYDASQLKWGG